jgi:CIC family chloride channel protein
MDEQEPFLSRIRHRARERLRFLSSRTVITEHGFVFIVAIVIGVIAGFGSLLIRVLIQAISGFSFPGEGSLLENIIAAPWYVKLLVPTAGGLIVGPLIHFFAREAKGHGVPEVMQSLILKGGVIRPRVALVKILASAITIGTGGSVGREGPVIQIGAGVGSGLGQIFKVSNLRMRTFVGCGAAAGIAAAFNAPIAGALFAVEILLQDFTFTQFSPIVISSVIATAISHHFEGNLAAFPVPGYSLNSYHELGFYFVLAIITAIVALVFIRTLYFSEDFFDHRLKMPEWLKPALGGLIMGGLAIAFPQVMGVGYETISQALQGQTIGFWLLALIGAKILATSIVLGSGGSGGVFAPSLFLGALTGAFFGGVLHGWFPEITANPGAYALVAMGGLVAATTRAPITAIIMVFELTSDYRIILPLMIVCIFSTVIAAFFSRESIYTLKLVQRGILLKDGAETNIMRSIFVGDIYTRDVNTLQEEDTFEEVVNTIITGRDPYFPVMNSEGNLTGIISLHDIKEYLNQGDHLKALLIAEDMSNKDPIRVHLNEDCQTALDRMGRNNLMGLPVVDPKKPDRLLGMIWRKDIIDAYNREVESRDIASSFASRITMKNIDQSVHFMEGYAVTEIPVPKSFVGHTIRDLGIRADYGVDVLLIRRNDEKGSRIKAIPNPEYVFSYNDSIVVAGEIGKIEHLKTM